MYHPLPVIARKIVAMGLMEEAKAAEIYDLAKKSNLSFLNYAFEKNLIKTENFAYTLSSEFGLPLLDLKAYNIDIAPQNIISVQLMQTYNILPLYKRGNILFIALADPSNFQALDEIKFHVHMQIEPILVEYNKLKSILSKTISMQEAAQLGNLEGDESLDIQEEVSNQNTQITAGQDDKPIVKFINKILLESINSEASDIHFEPFENIYRIRTRIDGILYEHSTPAKTLASRISTRLKVMAHLDISERRVPQDGRFRMRISKTRHIDFRVSSCPTLYGEKIVLRILDPVTAEMGIDKLGFEPSQQKHFLEEIFRPHGICLVTGPTGSGKTVTLYTALNLLNQMGTNISTCEDPVELNIPGVNQVHVNPKAGMTFAVALKAFLRQDPDIIMVGEIRDLETAAIAIKAAQTGHLVLSTLHTNSAADTLTRLINMGIEPFNLATSVSLIVAQRLGRRLCSACKEPVTVPEQTLLEAGFKPEEISNLKLYGPKGCVLCKQGYKGRVGFFEVMPIDKEMQQVILDGANAIEINKIAEKKGINTLRRSGLNRVKEGITSLDEINRVTKE